MRDRATANPGLSDVAKRFRKNLDNCKSVEQALLRCSSNSSTTLKDLITFREEQITELENELSTALNALTRCR